MASVDFLGAENSYGTKWRDKKETVKVPRGKAQNLATRRVLAEIPDNIELEGHGKVYEEGQAWAKGKPAPSELPTDYQAFIHLSRYSRWIEEKGRRETWVETVGRYFSFMAEHLKSKLNYSVPQELLHELTEAVLNLEVMPSMRCLMTAGPALKRSNIAAYNCSYIPIDDPLAFSEMLYVLLCGTGIGFSVERSCIQKLPVVPAVLNPSGDVIRVEDSKEGWANAFRAVIRQLFAGQLPQWDLSRVRAAGTRLKSFGGRASGPGPLDDLLRFTVKMIQGAKGRRLTTLECHDLCCKVAEVVVVGGVRRSALISLSDMDDDAMRQAKAGAWWERHPHRALSNNSAVYDGRPPMGTFMSEWISIYQSGSGERGIFNRRACEQHTVQVAPRRQMTPGEYGTNPCSEIILRPYSFCNLSEVVVRADDNKLKLKRKARLAAVLGTFQSTLVDFPFLRPKWQENAEEERLMGVSLTGILDNTFLSGRAGNSQELAEFLTDLKGVVVSTNESLAHELGIRPSSATTCVKPSGTVSQLADTASGIHPRHSRFYIRRVRGDKKDPLTQFMIDAGVPHEDCCYKPESTIVFSFPIKAPQDCITRDEVTAFEHLELCLLYQRNWCEHKPSVTITVREDEWMQVGSWMYDHFDEISGVTFLPYDCGTYKQTPYEVVDEATYEKLLAVMPPRIDWTQFSENYDRTKLSMVQLVCTVGGGCENVDIGAA